MEKGLIFNMLYDEIKQYIDKNGLVCPNPVEPDVIRGSDNGTAFTSEYYCMLVDNNQLLDSDPLAWETVIRSCMRTPGLTVRAPGDLVIDAPDNIVAILGAAKRLNVPSVAKDMLSYGIRHLGVYDPQPEGTPWNWSAFQFRQVQLVFAMLCASNTYKWYKFWYWPLALYTALVILVSCYKTPTEDTDSRRLCWSLINATTKDSLLCRLVSVVWWKRLRKDYGDEGYRAVCSIYYKPNGEHPFAKYAVNPWENDK